MFKALTIIFAIVGALFFFGVVISCVWIGFTALELLFKIFLPILLSIAILGIVFFLLS